MIDAVALLKSVKNKSTELAKQDFILNSDFLFSKDDVTYRLSGNKVSIETFNSLCESYDYYVMTGRIDDNTKRVILDFLSIDDLENANVLPMYDYSNKYIYRDENKLESVGEYNSGDFFYLNSATGIKINEFNFVKNLLLNSSSPIELVDVIHMGLATSGSTTSQVQDKMRIHMGKYNLPLEDSIIEYGFGDELNLKNLITLNSDNVLSIHGFELFSNGVKSNYMSYSDISGDLLIGLGTIKYNQSERLVQISDGIIFNRNAFIVSELFSTTSSKMLMELSGFDYDVSDTMYIRSTSSSIYTNDIKNGFEFIIQNASSVIVDSALSNIVINVSGDISSEYVNSLIIKESALFTDSVLNIDGDYDGVIYPKQVTIGGSRAQIPSKQLFATSQPGMRVYGSGQVIYSELTMLNNKSISISQNKLYAKHGSNIFTYQPLPNDSSVLKNVSSSYSLLPNDSQYSNIFTSHSVHKNNTGNFTQVFNESNSEYCTIHQEMMRDVGVVPYLEDFKVNVNYTNGRLNLTCTYVFNKSTSTYKYVKNTTNTPPPTILSNNTWQYCTTALVTSATNNYTTLNRNTMNSVTFVVGLSDILGDVILEDAISLKNDSFTGMQFNSFGSRSLSQLIGHTFPVISPSTRVIYPINRQVGSRNSYIGNTISGYDQSLNFMVYATPILCDINSSSNAYQFFKELLEANTNSSPTNKYYMLLTVVCPQYPQIASDLPYNIPYSSASGYCGINLLSTDNSAKVSAKLNRYLGYYNAQDDGIKWPENDSEFDSRYSRYGLYYNASFPVLDS